MNEVNKVLQTWTKDLYEFAGEQDLHERLRDIYSKVTKFKAKQHKRCSVSAMGLKYWESGIHDQRYHHLTGI